VTEQDLTVWMRWFADELARLEDSRSTTLEIIDRPGSERYWQAILAYFLDPSESHGLGTTVLETFTEVIADHPKVTASGLTNHLETPTVWLHDGELYSFTGLTKEILNKLVGRDKDKPLNGYSYWVHPDFDGRMLLELREADVRVKPDTKDSFVEATTRGRD